MRLVPQRPVTVEAVRYGERWFPFLFRHTDGSLLLYVEHGHDAHFSPCFRMRSTDQGKTWGDACDNVPRTQWCHSFADGELFEWDAYGVHDPKTQATAAFFGAWSFPGQSDQPVRKELIRLHAPSARKEKLNSMARGGYPTFHWWPLWNQLHGTDQLSGDEIHLNGPNITTGVELADGRLLALGYWPFRADGKYALWCYASSDRGRNWEEIATVARADDTPEGPDEATLVQLDDGRLYAIARTGGTLIHMWSSDLGKTWTPHEKMRLIDEPNHDVGKVWPVMKKLSNGTLALVYGRPGKNMIFDPSGTGTQWQGRLDLHAWELDTQKLMGVPEQQRLNNSFGDGVRYWNSGDYLALVEIAPREMLVMYDVQGFVESWNANPISGVRMVKVNLED